MNPDFFLQTHNAGCRGIKSKSFVGRLVISKNDFAEIIVFRRSATRQ